MSLTARDHLVGGVLAAAFLAVLLGTMGIGFGRDEGYYFHAGERYVRWFDELAAAVGEGAPARAFSRSAIEEHFSYNPEHPPLYKALFGLSWRLFGRMAPPEGVELRRAKRWYRDGLMPAPILGWLPESVAFRLPTAATAALLVWLLYLFGTEAFDRRVGIAAALLFAALPRAFYHAHLAAFDLPIAAWTFATLYAIWRSTRSNRWGPAIVAGLLWGVAVSVKLNGFFIPFIALLWWVLLHAPGLLRGRLPRVPRAVWTMALFGPLLFLLLWPYHWHDTVSRISWYLGRHWKHEYYWAHYFGHLLVKPPFPLAFPFVMTAVTTPLSTLGLSLAGLGRAALSQQARGRHGAALLWFVALMVPFAIIAMPGVPVFGGTKHWLAGIPFLCLFAGLAFAAVHDAAAGLLRISGPGPRATLAAALALLFLAPPAFAVARAHPDEVAYYNELLGGPRGAGEHGMQREFWGSTARDILPWLNAHAPKHAKVHWHDTNWDSYLLYRRDGLVRPDIRYVTDPARADLYLFHWHKEFLNDREDVRVRWGAGGPIHVHAPEGVPLLEVLARP